MQRSMILPAILLGFVVTASAASAATDPIARTEDLVRAFKGIKPAPEDGSTLDAATKKSNAATFTKLDGFFNFERITRDPLAAHASKFTKAQLDTFSDAFRQLIRLVAYSGSSNFFEKATYKLKVGKRKGKSVDVEMKAYLKDQDINTTVTFHWEEDAGGELSIVDVSFDGASLIKDYSNQFGRIINKDGVEGLLSKVNKRLDKELQQSIITP